MVVSELVTDFIDNLPCSEEKVALEVVGVHCTMRRWRVMENAGVGDPGNQRRQILWEVLHARNDGR